MKMWMKTLEDEISRCALLTEDGHKFMENVDPWCETAYSGNGGYKMGVYYLSYV
jgi:hypothetical protein